MNNNKITVDISQRFQQYISEIEVLLNPELKSDINKLRKIDLNDYLMYPEN